MPNHPRLPGVGTVSNSRRETDGHARTRRGTDIASIHHHLLVAQMRLKLEKQCTTGQTILQRVITTFLQYTEKLNQFNITLNTGFQALQDLLTENETTMKNNWYGFK